MLDLAAAMFAKDGYHGTSIRGLAERAGINAASLYHYFPSKQAALFEVCLAGAEQSAIRIERVMATHGAMPTRLSAILEGHVQDLEVYSDYRHVYFEQRSNLSPEQLALIDAVSRRVRSELVALFEQGAAAGELHPDLTPRQATLTFVATLRALTQFYVEGPPRDYASIADGLTRVMLRGLSSCIG
ncbi:TetR family transcriptional regulator [Sphingobium sp. AEW010]|nr:TetR family transcriptional regulator [Sphingobium sp. AEW010]TWD23209.1 TetR family transcriptional regulator [Sphingobium sp. AEW013]TWD25069.1 TetR family transcriptional regulator [Sphingobium sp. AEW001]